jgi:hypothetical protein
MTPHRSILKSESKMNSKITIADDSEIQVVSSGEVTASIQDTVIGIKNVLYVPKLGSNLLSVHQLVTNGNKVVFDKSGCTIYSNDGKIVANCVAKKGVYTLEMEDKVGKCLISTNQQSDMMQWHRKLGHINAQSLMKMKKIVDGVMFSEKDEASIKNCTVCAEGKQHALPFGKSTRKSTRVLQLVHSDLCGPMETASVGKNKYFMTFIDDYTRKIFVYFLANKSQAHDRFCEFKAAVENETGEKIACIRSDNGGEYVNAKFDGFLVKHGIRHETTIAYTAEQNGVAERANRSIVEKAKCLLFDSGLSKQWWAEAVNYAVFLINRSFSSVHQKTPNEIFFRQRVDLSDLKMFGTEVMVMIPKTKRAKFDRNSEKLKFVGMDNTSKGFRCVNPSTGKLTVSRNVKFLEDSTPRVTEIPGDESEEAEMEGERPKTEPRKPSFEEVFEDADDEEEKEEIPKPVLPVPTGPRTRSVSNKTNDPPAPLWTGRLAVIDEISFAEKVDDAKSLEDPDSFKEVKQRSDKKDWIDAMKCEFESLLENDTWELCELPERKKLIDTKWVFKTKRDNDGNVVRHKARLVAKGFVQRFGIDYEETFAPVVRYTSIRFLIALAVKKGMHIHQMDAVTAFLQGEIDKEIFIKQPEGFEDGSNRVCRLKKAIYGLKQSSRMWNIRLDTILKRLGFIKIKMDQCIYHLQDQTIIVAVYVDDILFFYTDVEKLNVVKKLLQENCRMKDLGMAKGCIGLKIVQKQGEITLDQIAYIKEILNRFGMTDCKPMGNPCDTNLKLTVCVEGEEDLTGKVPYQQAIGALLFVAQATRPDIAFAVNNASRFNQKHNASHWAAVKRIFRYLKKTENYKLVFNGKIEGELKGYCDADFGSDVDSRKSMSGYVFLYANAAVSWRASKQQTVSLSSTEAEYIALVECIKEAIWISQLVGELTIKPKGGLIINCDNTSTISLAKNDQYSNRTKHIDIRHKFIREKLEDEAIEIVYVNTNSNIADVFTKPITKEKLDKFSAEMGLKL